MKPFGFFLPFILISGLSQGTDRVIPLPEVTRPNGSIQFSKNYLYITQKENVLIYDLKDFQFLRSFGKKGEGPGEFHLFPSILVKGGKIIMKDLR